MTPTSFFRCDAPCTFCPEEYGGCPRQMMTVVSMRNGSPRTGRPDDPKLLLDNRSDDASVETTVGSDVCAPDVTALIDRQEKFEAHVLSALGQLDAKLSALGTGRVNLAAHQTLADVMVPTGQPVVAGASGLRPPLRDARCHACRYDSQGGCYLPCRGDVPEGLNMWSGAHRPSLRSQLVSGTGECEVWEGPAVPVLLHIESPNGQQACSGDYELQLRERANGQPVWKKRGGLRWLYSGAGRRWLVGGADMQAQGFRGRGGFLYSGESHDGAMPDLLRCSWRRWDGEQFQDDLDIVIKAVVPETPMRVAARRPYMPPLFECKESL